MRFYRTAARRTKTVVAGLAGITPDYLYQIERGQKLPTIPVLAQLAGRLAGNRPAAPISHASSVKAGSSVRWLSSVGRSKPPWYEPQRRLRSGSRVPGARPAVGSRAGAVRSLPGPSRC
ncbi:helix-turn-helix transcriptional regulator [Amycolatopsis sp. DG1A-15b]|uniref:helix-turn-helix domain-containing protein n=1 Tax=Amycolatopsis sp. DG1A-15b TaxID=3052846 RepID=UPI00255C0031|nr:helix-turn-helix transcriptional regulator [Amycolatopsis sp. DG1A-15b]WIX92572.1 helix-turn-helix transcriptional regulator [Amycolatopsis sp. DG1A-15b]